MFVFLCVLILYTELIYSHNIKKRKTIYIVQTEEPIKKKRRMVRKMKRKNENVNYKTTRFL